MRAQVTDKNIVHRQELKEAKRKQQLECVGKLARKMQWIEGLSPIVFGDVDRTFRWLKDKVPYENTEAVRHFRAKGGLLMPITGAPLVHVPSVLRGSFTFAESGGVLQLPNRRIVVLAPQLELSAVEELQLLLGIGVQYGLGRIDGKLVFVEGPRYASLTLAVGAHPDSPEKRYDQYIEFEELLSMVLGFIDDHQLPLVATKGVAEDGSYAWIDVTTQFQKHDLVDCFQEAIGQKEVHYIGDGSNDVVAIRFWVPYVTSTV